MIQKASVYLVCLCCSLQLLFHSPFLCDSKCSLVVPLLPHLHFLPIFLSSPSSFCLSHLLSLPKTWSGLGMQSLESERETLEGDENAFCVCLSWISLSYTQFISLPSWYLESWYSRTFVFNKEASKVNFMFYHTIWESMQSLPYSLKRHLV